MTRTDDLPPPPDADPYSVEVGPGVWPSPGRRVGALLGTGALVVLLGVLVAITVGAVLLIVALLVSAAIN